MPVEIQAGLDLMTAAGFVLRMSLVPRETWLPEGMLPVSFACLVSTMIHWG